MCESIDEKLAFATTLTVIHGPSRITGLSCWINASCVTLALPLMISLTLSRRDLTLFFAGLISSLPSYLRTFWPRKSKTVRNVRDPSLLPRAQDPEQP